MTARSASRVGYAAPQTKLRLDHLGAPVRRLDEDHPRAAGPERGHSSNHRLCKDTVTAHLTLNEQLQRGDPYFVAVPAKFASVRLATSEVRPQVNSSM